jgi:hypothetical protein
VNSFLTYVGAGCREHFIPGWDLSLNTSVVGFKGKISVITRQLKKSSQMGIQYQLRLHIHSFITAELAQRT